MLNKIKLEAINIGKKLFRYGKYLNELDRLRKENQELKTANKPFGFPAGHYYSPIHSIEDLKSYDDVAQRSKGKFVKSIPGFSEKKMLEEVNRVKKFFSDFKYPQKDDENSRFYIQNDAYPVTDALMLFSMIRSLKPKRIVEIGSGFSSALMMDVNERFFDNKIDIVFIEPYPDLLIQRMKEKDKIQYRIIPSGIQFVPLDIFKTLEKGDILFIDSTHVSKFNSDVNYELFDILPVLKSGVTIHFHDVFDGFEYPKVWLNDGWAWNEDYILRAYLIGNIDYEVLLMNDYLNKRHPQLLMNSLPKGAVLNGGSLWIKKK